MHPDAGRADRDVPDVAAQGDRVDELRHGQDWQWVSKVAAGCDPGPNKDPAAPSIRGPSSAQPASTSTHDGPERTKINSGLPAPHGPRQNACGAICRATSPHASGAGSSRPPPGHPHGDLPGRATAAPAPGDEPDNRGSRVRREVHDPMMTCSGGWSRSAYPPVTPAPRNVQAHPGWRPLPRRPVKMLTRHNVLFGCATDDQAGRPGRAPDQAGRRVFFRPGSRLAKVTVGNGYRWYRSQWRDLGP